MASKKYYQAYKFIYGVRRKRNIKVTNNDKKLSHGDIG